MICSELVFIPQLNALNLIQLGHPILWHKTDLTRDLSSAELSRFNGVTWDAKEKMSKKMRLQKSLKFVKIK